jgi:uncharacterized protein YecE (DUF72 family)
MLVILYDKNFLDFFMENFYRALIIVRPYGKLIHQGIKRMIVKSRKLNILGQKLLLVEDKVALGFLTLDRIEFIDLHQFKLEYKKHRITPEDRQKWWPNRRHFYGYRIANYQPLDPPVLVNYPPGPQILVKPQNISLRRIYLGTSGYYYPQFYPRGVHDLLRYYVQFFNALEVNYTFYHFPTQSLIDHLRKYQIVYIFKVHRSITHLNRLKNFAHIWSHFIQGLDRLEQLYGFLFQFDTHFIHHDQTIKRLAKIAPYLDKKYLYAFEFRSPGWEAEISLFKKYGWCFVNRTQNSCTYLRLHGQNYQGSYSDQELEKFYHKIVHHPTDQNFIFFNNTDDGSAFKDCLRFIRYFNKLNL